MASVHYAVNATLLCKDLNLLRLVLEEIVLQNLGDFQESVRVNGFATIDFIDIGAVAV